MSKLKTTTFFILFLLCFLPRLVQAQLKGIDKDKKIILDAVAVQQSATKFAFLANELTDLNSFLQKASDIGGIRLDYFPLEIPVLSEQKQRDFHLVCAELTIAIAKTQSTLRANLASIKPESYSESQTILSEHPGAYYLGFDESLLCDHVLRKEMNVIQLQDYPFSEAADGDKCLWTLGESAPNLSQIIVFGCEIDDATLVKMQLEKLLYLSVLDLAENQLTQIPSKLFTTGTLRSLDLSKNKFSQLPADLKPFQGLVYLNLRGNPNISPAERDRIAKALPKTKVEF